MVYCCHLAAKMNYCSIDRFDCSRSVIPPEINTISTSLSSSTISSEKSTSQTEYDDIPPSSCFSSLTTEYPDLRSYFNTNYRMTKPLCLSHGAQNWIAIEKWKDVEYLQSVATDVTECTMRALDGETFLKHEFCDIMEIGSKLAIQKIMKFETDERMYCRLYFESQPLLASDTNYKELESLFLHENQSQFEPKNCGIWISSSGCITPLHYDLCHGLLVQISGRKRFILASPQETIYLYPNRDPYSKNQTSSLVNLTKWIAGDLHERRRYPAIDEAQWYLVDLLPGDILYTPPGWWHYVVSLDQSISVLLPFDMSQHENLHPLQCV